MLHGLCKYEKRLVDYVFNISKNYNIDLKTGVTHIAQQ